MDLTKETKRAPVVKGDDAFEVSLRMVSEVKRKNDALKRALKLYQRCRET